MLAIIFLLTLIISCLPLAKPQLVQSLPQCVQDCIDQSEDENCSISDIKCLCRESAGNFLPDLVTCMHGNCDNELDNNLLLMPLQFACDLAGAPIPDSAIQNAEDVGNSLATQVTRTVTVGGGPSVTGSAFGDGFTTTVSIASPSITTVTITATERDGSIIVIAYPVTDWQTTTVSGSGSIVTSAFNGAAVSTSGEYTTPLVQPFASSGSTSVLTTGLATAKASSSDTTASKTIKAPTADETNSSPFKDESSPAVRWEIHHWEAFGILLLWGILWL